MSREMIEVPVDTLRTLLISNDSVSRMELLSFLERTDPLFGRWATHSEFGRVLCVSEREDGGKVFVRWSDRRIGYGIGNALVEVDSLTFDPLTLTTVYDFLDAPDGTVVENYGLDMRIKNRAGWTDGSTSFSAGDMADCGTWKVVRWGDGK